MTEPFAGRTGRGVSVAVIDSGCHPIHDHIAAAHLRPGVMILADGAVVEGDEVWHDRLGHGTAVTAALQEKAPDADVIPVRVFRDALKTSAAALVAAIRWSVAQRVDLINLSLGSVNPAHREVFQAAVDEAAAAGIAVVAAREAAEATPCFPGALEPVIGVEVDWDCPREAYVVRQSESACIIAASGYPRPIPGVPMRRNLYGVSFAVAQASGFAARACEALPADLSGPQRVQRLRRLVADGAPTA